MNPSTAIRIIVVTFIGLAFSVRAKVVNDENALKLQERIKTYLDERHSKLPEISDGENQTYISTEYE
jgi:signal transduction histidine kinase